MAAAATSTETTAPIRYGSLTRDATTAAAPQKFTPAPLPRGFLPVPGSRLISNISAFGERSGDLAESQPYRKHEQWRDIVDDERIESTVTDTQALQRVGELDRKPQACGQR